MATNLQIDTRLLEEAQRIGAFKTKKETVNKALEALIMQIKRQQFLELQHMIDYYPDYDYKAAREKR